MYWRRGGRRFVQTEGVRTRCNVNVTRGSCIRTRANLPHGSTPAYCCVVIDTQKSSPCYMVMGIYCGR